MRLYCWIKWEAFSRGTFTLKRDYKKWYELSYGKPALPWKASKSGLISFILHNLEKKGAIKIEKRSDEIILIDFIGKGEGGKEREYILLPSELWTLGWIEKLSCAELYTYLVNLAEFKKSPYKPVWINSHEKLSREYGISWRTLWKSLKKLMYYNLIEIKHDIPDPGQPFDKKKANRYFINPLWGEKGLQKKWVELAERHGPDLFRKARELATRINEPYDPEAVASLIMLAKIYGLEAVKGAVDTATKLSFGNGKWEMRYIIGILQKDYAPLK